MARSMLSKLWAIGLVCKVSCKPGTNHQISSLPRMTRAAVHSESTKMVKATCAR